MKKIFGGVLIAIPFVAVIAEGARKFGWTHALTTVGMLLGMFLVVTACIGIGVYLIFSDDK